MTASDPAAARAEALQAVLAAADRGDTSPATVQGIIADHVGDLSPEDQNSAIVAMAKLQEKQDNS